MGNHQSEFENRTKPEKQGPGILSWRKRLKYRAAFLIDHVAAFLLRHGRGKLTQGQVEFLRKQGGRFLLIALDQLGDTVLGTAVPPAIKGAFPESRITVLTRPVNQAVLLENPYVAEFLLDRAPWWSGRPLWNSLRPGYWITLFRNIRKIRREEFDVMIDLRGDLRHILFFRVLGRGKILLSYARTGGGAFLSADLTYDPHIPEVAKKVGLLQPLGIRVRAPRPGIWLQQKEKDLAGQFVRKKLPNADPPVVLVDPGAKPVQQWPVDRFADLIRAIHKRLGKPVLISAGPAYLDLAEELAIRVGPEKGQPVGAIDLRFLIALVDACDLVVSADTGVAHIASAVGVRCVTLFGPTDPGRFWAGIAGSRMIRSKIACREFDLHEKCFQTRSSQAGACMMAVTEKEVEGEVLAALDELARCRTSGGPKRFLPEGNNGRAAKTPRCKMDV